VTGIVIANGRASSVATSAGEFGFDQLLIAAGPQTGRLVAGLGVDLPLGVGRAEIVVTEPLPLMRYGGVDGNGLYGRQTLRGNLVYGGGPHEWLDPDATAPPPNTATPLLRNIAARLTELFPKAAHARLLRSWAGIVENTPDGRPVIDRLPGHDKIVVATMSSVGFGLSPASGRAIMELLPRPRRGLARGAGMASAADAGLTSSVNARSGATKQSTLVPDGLDCFAPFAMTATGIGSYQEIWYIRCATSPGARGSRPCPMTV